MEATETEALLQQVTHQIVERFHPERIVLFGSRAHGEARSDSDLDLFVKMETDRFLNCRAPS
jgi:predicted nucleotidyltransferase